MRLAWSRYGGQLVTPVGDRAPLRVGVERVERLVERVGVDQRAAADTRPRHDQHVAEHVEALDPVAADLRGEEVLAHVKGRRGEVVVLEAGTGLEDSDRVALLGEPQSGDAAAEPGPDDENVVVEGTGRRAHGRPSLLSSRIVAVITLA
jgi:hypothetical protein